MSERDRITEPSMGSNKLGTETNRIYGEGISAGTDTQMKLAALSTEKKAKDEKEKEEKKKQNKKDGKDLPGKPKTDK